MSARVVNLRFRGGLNRAVLLVLEPSEGSWQVTFGLAKTLITTIGGRVSHVCFMGNNTRYPISFPQDFVEAGPGWFRENVNRVRLIGPILESMQRERFQGMVLILCSQPPVDVEDWVETELIERVVFVNTAAKRDERWSILEEHTVIESSYGASAITELVNNPVKGLMVRGEGFVPLACTVTSKGKLSIQWQGGQFEVRVLPQEEQIDLHLMALCTEDIPVLCVQRQRGSEEAISGEEEHLWFDPPNWQAIPRDLVPVVQAGIRRAEFVCPQCGGQHPYDQQVCPQGDIILKGMPLNTCLLFTPERYLALSQYYAYPLRSNRAVITQDGRLYQRSGKRWELVRAIGVYDQVDDEIWAIFHRA